MRLLVLIMPLLLLGCAYEELPPEVELQVSIELGERQPSVGWCWFVTPGTGTPPNAPPIDGEDTCMVVQSLGVCGFWCIRSYECDNTYCYVCPTGDCDEQGYWQYEGQTCICEDSTVYPSPWLPGNGDYD
jgi:hypothetical protein